MVANQIRANLVWRHYYYTKTRTDLGYVRWTYSKNDDHCRFSICEIFGTRCFILETVTDQNVGSSRRVV